MITGNIDTLELNGVMDDYISLEGTMLTYGPKGDKGDKGDPGDPGFSPIAIVEETSSGATITITDSVGTTSASVLNGADGQDGQDGVDGQDGFSPTASVTKSGSTATISITDKNGTTTATVSDGQNGSPGAPGQDGEDGYSPSATVSKVGKIATITITDKDGTTTAEIRDGEDGQGSGDMLKATYDTNDNGIVDNAEKVNNHTVLTDVPADAVFTDTTYTAGTNVSISNENVISATNTTYTAGTNVSISEQNVISATDTTYTAGTGIDITNGVISNTQTSAEWGNISGTISTQTDLMAELLLKRDMTPTKLNDTEQGTSDSPYILNTMNLGYYYVETPAGYSTKYFKLTSTTNAMSITNNASGDGCGFYIYIPYEIEYSELSEGDTIFYCDIVSQSSSGSLSNNISCYVYSASSTSKMSIDNAKSYNKLLGTILTTGTQTFSGAKTFNSVPSCSTAPTSNNHLSNKKYVDDSVGTKQDTLVSGTNIKTINNTSLLGSGNITISADDEVAIQTTQPTGSETVWINPNDDVSIAGNKIEVLTGEIVTTALTPDIFQMSINYPSGFSWDNCVVIGGCLGSMSIPCAIPTSNNTISTAIETYLGSENILFFWYNPDKEITTNYKIVLMRIS